MIFRISTKISKKIHLTRDEILPVDCNPFADWSVHLFTVERIQYVLITNTISLYSMVMFGRGLKDEQSFRERVTDYMSEFIRTAGHKSIVENFIVPSMDTVRFSKALNRSVTGSMNDFIWQAKYHLTDDDLSLFEVGLLLNETPMSYLGRSSPMDVFPKLAITEAIGITPPDA